MKNKILYNLIDKIDNSEYNILSIEKSTHICTKTELSKFFKTTDYIQLLVCKQTGVMFLRCTPNGTKWYKKQKELMSSKKK